MRHHAFELDPGAPRDYRGTLNEMLAAKYSLTLERAAELNHRVEDDARALGLKWSLDKARPTNTLDAHRVVTLAARHGREGEMLELLLAYFSEGLLLGDRDALVTPAAQGDVPGVAAMLDTNKFIDAVRHDEHLSAQIGVPEVPALVFDGRIHLAGARDTDAMLQVLRST